MKKFQGVESSNYTQIPNVYFDVIADLTNGEFKVLLYIARRKFGFERDSDNISISQIANGNTKKDGTILDKGTGLSKRQVIKAIKSLVGKRDILKKIGTLKKEELIKIIEANL
ncbi:hypothetical protein ES703_64900 [subsurface metagenome]